MWLCVLPARGVENFKAGQAEVTIAGLRHYWYGAHALRKMSCLILKMIAKLLKLLVRLKALSAGSSIFPDTRQICGWDCHGKARRDCRRDEEAVQHVMY